MSGLVDKIRHIGFVDRFLHDQSFANLVMLCAGAFGNLVLAVFNGALLIMDPSPWLAAMTVYFVALVMITEAISGGVGTLLLLLMGCSLIAKLRAS